jgi:hypothetical protein
MWEDGVLSLFLAVGQALLMTGFCCHSMKTTCRLSFSECHNILSSHSLLVNKYTFVHFTDDAKDYLTTLADLHPTCNKI